MYDSSDSAGHVEPLAETEGRWGGRGVRCCDWAKRPLAYGRLNNKHTQVVLWDILLYGDVCYVDVVSAITCSNILTCILSGDRQVIVMTFKGEWVAFKLQTTPGTKIRGSVIHLI